MSEPIISMQDVNGQQINQLKWSYDEREILWSVGGNSMTMWDLNDSKAKFVHAGHMQKINQIDLHPTEPRTIASVDDDNEIQVFQPTKNASL